MNNKSYVGVVDFGSQTTMLIARRIRELGVLAKILPAAIDIARLKDDLPLALIFSGGPESLRDTHATRIDPKIFELDIPILGICYGMQLIVDHFNGSVIHGSFREFGNCHITINNQSQLFKGLTNPLNVWMSHFDQVSIDNTDFSSIAHSENCLNAAIECAQKKIFGVQFHPEVSHSEQGSKILHNFIFTIAKATCNFDMRNFCTDKIHSIKEQVKENHVLMGLSLGVDSSVAAVLIHRAIREQLHCVYVDHGLHRQGEIEEIKTLCNLLEIDLHIVDARDQFFSALLGVLDPEAKRKKIGHAFIDVFQREAKRFSEVKFLGQGTLYPDVIESYGNGLSHTIKSHHNVGGLPDSLNLTLIEPLRELFKDEVRVLGSLLGLPESLVRRQPFPGPGLAVRIPGEVTRERVDTLQRADAIVREEIDKAYGQGLLTKRMWQWFAILLPVKSVGVMGDARSYGETIVIRCVESSDAMTADWANLPHELLRVISSRITNEVMGISRVLYDITQKPPGTIEWE